MVREKQTADAASSPKISTKASAELNSERNHTNQTKYVGTPNGTRRQDAKSGKFKSGHFDKGEEKRTTTPKTSINTSAKIEKGKMTAEGKFSVSEDVIRTSAKFSHTAYQSRGDYVDFKVETAAAKVEAAISKTGYAFEAGVSGPKLVMSTSSQKPLSFCIGSTLIQFEGEVSTGLGLGFKSKMGVMPNKTNDKKHFVLETNLGTGLQFGGKMDIGASPHDAACEPKPPVAAPAASQVETPAVEIPPSPLTATANRSPAGLAAPIVEEPELNEQQKLENISAGLTELGLSQADIAQVEARMIADFGVDDSYQQVNQALQVKTLQSQLYRQQQIQGIADGVDFLGNLGSVCRCEPLVKTAKVCRHLLSGYEAVEKIARLGAFKGGAGVSIGNFANLGSAILGIFGAFLGGGPDPTQLILDAIQGLSDQIKSLSAETREQFYQMAKQQEKSLKYTMKGIEEMGLQMRNGFTSVRIDIAHYFDRLDAQMKFMLKLVNKNDQALLLQKFNELCDEVETWRTGRHHGNPKEQVPRLANQLFSSIKTLASNPILNGQNIWTVHAQQGLPHEILADVIELNPARDATDISINLNWIQAFLVNHGKLSIAKVLRNRPQPNPSIAKPRWHNVRAESMVNPLVMAKAIENYLILKSTQPLFDNDPSGKDIDEIKALVKHQSQFIEEVGKDTLLFDSLVYEYVEALKEANTCLENFNTFKSQELTSLLQADTATKETTKQHDHEIAPQGNIVLNLLHEDVDTVIQKFATRKLNFLENDIGLIDGVVNENLRFSKKRLYLNCGAAQDSKFAVLLAGEYLKVWSFSADQQVTIQGREWGPRYEYLIPAVHVGQPVTINNLAQEKIAEFAEGKAIKLSYGGGICASAARPNNCLYGYPEHAGIGRGASHIIRQVAPHLCLDAENWQLIFDLKINNQPVANIVYKKDWQSAPQVNAHCWTGTPTIKKVNGVHYCHYGTSSPASHEEEFDANLIRYIFNLFNGGDAIADVKFTIPIDIAAYKNKLAEHLFQKRQNIAAELHNTQSSGHGQQYVNAFRAALVRLDKAVAMLKSYAVLCGKNTQTEVFANLVTSATLRSELAEYHRLTAPDFTRNICPTLMRLSADTAYHTNVLAGIMALPIAEVTTLDVNHPARILQQSLNKLKMFQRWKKLLLREFPDITSSSLEEHDLKCQIYGEQIFQESTNALLKSIHVKYYQDARFQALSHMNYAKSMEPAVYSKVFDDCVRFTTEEASHPLAIGREVILGYNVSEIKTQQWLFNVYRSGTGIQRWAPVVGFLSGFVAKYMRQAEITPLPTNLIMWSEGMTVLLKFLFNDKLEDTSLKAGYHVDGKLRAVNDCLLVGLRLQKWIYTIGLNEELFRRLFADYKTHINRFYAWVKQQHTTARDDNTVFRQLTSQASNSYSNTKLDAAAAWGMIILLLMEMLYQHDLDADHQFRSLLDFKDRAGFLDYLREKNHGDYKKHSLANRIDAHLAKIAALEEAVVSRITAAKQQYLLWSYLQNYFKQHKKTRLVIFNGAHLQTLGETNGELMNEFFSHYSHVNEIKLEDVTINQDSITQIATLLVSHPQVQVVSLGDKVIYTEKSMRLLQEVLSSLSGQPGQATALNAHPQQKAKAFSLKLELPIGPARLARLSDLAIKGHKLLTKRLWAERGGATVKSFAEIDYALTRELLAELDQAQPMLDQDLYDDFMTSEDDSDQFQYG